MESSLKAHSVAERISHVRQDRFVSSFLPMLQ